MHVACADGQAKFWLEPDIALAKNIGLSSVALNELIKVVTEHRDELIQAWRRHFA